MRNRSDDRSLAWHLPFSLTVVHVMLPQRVNGESILGREWIKLHLHRRQNCANFVRVTERESCITKRHEWNIAPKITAVHKYQMKNAFNLSFFISISISTPTTGDVSLRLLLLHISLRRASRIKAEKRARLMKFMHFSACVVVLLCLPLHRIASDIMCRQLCGIASTSSVIS